jgi:hypothetical protein
VTQLSLGKNSYYSLSIRQPWAGLILCGLKTVEVRSWTTGMRGRILIHAAKTRDERPEATRWVRPEFASFCQPVGGILGAVDLVECIAYTTFQTFEADLAIHLNDPAWFQASGLFGFRMANPIRLPFRPLSGQTRFFTVDNIELPPLIHPPEMRA